MSRADRRHGMTKRVQNALGVIERDGPPKLDVGRCHCGVESEVGTDQDVPGMLQLGRMVIFCPACRRAIKVFAGPKMMTRLELEGPDAPHHLSWSPKNYYKAAKPKKVPRTTDEGPGAPPTPPRPTT